MKWTRRGSATWQGGLEGQGTLSTESRALVEHPYRYSWRFGDERGANPEELIGAAHASCFTMALVLMLDEARLTATSLETIADVTLDQGMNGYDISAVHLTVRARIPGAHFDVFNELATIAKTACPVSKLLNSKITLDVDLLA